MPPIHNKILIVDINHDSNKLFQLIFKNYCEVYFASSVPEAFNILEGNEIKVIISDYLLVGFSVIDFFEEVSHQFPNIQSILLTEKLSHHQISEAINRGRIFNYYSKPVEPQKLVVAVSKAIEQYDLQSSNLALLQSLKSKNRELKTILSDLKSEEEKFRNIYNSSPDPIFIIDTKGHLLDCNPLSRSIFFKNREFIHNSLLSEYIHTPDAKAIDSYIIFVNDFGQHMIEVKMYSAESDEPKDYELNGYPVKFKGRRALMLSLRDLSVRKSMEMKVLNTIIQTEENERKRFAQELHDGLGPLLSTTKLYLNWFTRPDSKMDKGEIVKRMEETLEETIASLREISNNISPNTLMNFGLPAAIKTFINRINNVADIKFQYKIHLAGRLKPELEITIYRLVCEFINNSLKHSKANTIQLEITNEEYLKITCSDNGCGFDVQNVLDENKGSGLMNMRSRVKSLGGEYHLNSSINSGTVMEVKFVLNPKILEKSKATAK